jgi:hypothetical protein
VAVGQQTGQHRVVADVLGVGGEQLLQLIQEQADDDGLGGVQPGDDVAAASAEGLHESRW